MSRFQLLAFYRRFLDSLCSKVLNYIQVDTVTLSFKLFSLITGLEVLPFTTLMCRNIYGDIYLPSK